MAHAISRLEELRSLFDPHVTAEVISEREGRLVVSPRTTGEVAGIMGCAHANKLAVEIVGAGTKRGWGNPVRADLLLETNRLAGISEHSWQDLTATVGAGTTWAAMQGTLAEHKQQVALDPLWPEKATVGGIIATNDSGALRLKYGSLRDLIIGMTIVLADGTVAKSGGKVVKNVAGYDLHKLMIGAFGTLGVITEATFRLHPIPAQTRTWTISSPIAKSAGELVMKVLDSQLSVQAMQFRADTEGYAVDVELATLPEVLTLQIEALDGLARGVDGSRGELRDESPLSATNPFKAREELFAKEGGVVLKLTMLASAIARLSEEVVRLGGSAVTQATGIMFARFNEEDALLAVPGLYARIDVGRGGSLAVLRAPDGLLPPRPALTSGAERATALMREIKQRFDPNRIVNPGRFLGGI
jgi:glycolate oxidase FAD binding subunit